MSTFERLNTAILALDWHAPAKPAGVKKAITDLANHWVSYVNSSERRVAPPITQGAKLSRYAEWYTRGWALMPAEVRDALTHPRDIDATVWSALEDQLAYTVEGNQAAAKAAGELAKEIGAVSGQAIKGVVILAGAATCVLLAYAYARMPRFG